MMLELFLDNFFQFLFTLLLALGGLGGRYVKTRLDDLENAITQSSQELEEDINQLRGDHNALASEQHQLKRRLYGDDRDETHNGHLVETRDQFNRVFEHLEQMEADRKREHQKVERRLDAIARRLDAPIPPSEEADRPADGYADGHEYDAD